MLSIKATHTIWSTKARVIAEKRTENDLGATSKTVPACILHPSYNILSQITLRDNPFKEHEHEKATGFGPRHNYQPAIDGC